MRRILMIANTYAQLILAMQMNLTIFREDEVVLLLSDHSRGADKVADKLTQCKFFYDVHYVKSKEALKNRNKKEILRDYIEISLCNSNRFAFYINEIQNKCFDEMIIYNYDIDIIGLYSILSVLNSCIKVSLYEEGVLSYGVSTIGNFKQRIVRIVRNLFWKKDIGKALDKFYCYYPDLYQGNLKAEKIENIASCSQIAREIKKVFGLEGKNISYKEKYIFFTSIYDIDGELPVGEFDLLLKLADLVGRDNLIVKVHPRDNRNIYVENGLKVDRNSFAPWEAIQLCGDFRRNVFVTTASSSVLSGCLMLPYSIPTYFLYKLCDIEINSIAKRAASEIEKTLTNEKMKEAFSNIVIADKIVDVLQTEIGR